MINLKEQITRSLSFFREMDKLFATLDTIWWESSEDYTMKVWSFIKTDLKNQWVSPPVLDMMEWYLFRDPLNWFFELWLEWIKEQFVKPMAELFDDVSMKDWVMTFKYNFTESIWFDDCVFVKILENLWLLG